jgi:hypothetical protein
MKLVLVILLFVCLPAQAQVKVYLQNIVDSTRLHPLRLNRFYKISARTGHYERVKLIAFTDTSLAFRWKGRAEDTFHLRISEIVYVDKTPGRIQGITHLGLMILLAAPVVLVASPIVGIFDGWENARDGVVFSGLLAGGGLVLASPAFLFKRYEVGKKWRLIVR